MSQRNKDNSVCAFVSGFITEYLWDAEIKVHTKPLHLVLLFLVALSSCVFAHREILVLQEFKKRERIGRDGFSVLMYR